MEEPVVNGPLAGSTWEMAGASGELLVETLADVDGHRSAVVTIAGPYRIRTTGRTIDGEAYGGSFEAAYDADSRRDVTPFSTALVRLGDEGGFNINDAASLIGVVLGVEEDPFMPGVSPGNVDLEKPYFFGSVYFYDGFFEKEGCLTILTERSVNILPQ